MVRLIKPFHIVMLIRPVLIQSGLRCIQWVQTYTLVQIVNRVDTSICVSRFLLGFFCSEFAVSSIMHQVACCFFLLFKFSNNNMQPLYVFVIILNLRRYC